MNHKQYLTVIHLNLEAIFFFVFFLFVIKNYFFRERQTTGQLDRDRTFLPHFRNPTDIGLYQQIIDLQKTTELDNTVYLLTSIVCDSKNTSSETTPDMLLRATCVCSMYILGLRGKQNEYLMAFHGAEYAGEHNYITAEHFARESARECKLC